MKHILLTFIYVFSLVITATGENVSGNITGNIFDEETNQALEYVSVAVFIIKGNSLISGTISDKQGNFNIKGLEQGQYYVEVSFLGYDKIVLDDIQIDADNTNVDLGRINLPRSVSQLDEVEIVADEMMVEYKIDRKVINVSQQLTAASGSAVDILENLPSITVDVEGNVSLRGSTGFMVFIDGRPTVLESSEALQQIPANTIENIEIITNPSAKYNPDGTAGIININTKKK